MEQISQGKTDFTHAIISKTVRVDCSSLAAKHGWEAHIEKEDVDIKRIEQIAHQNMAHRRPDPNREPGFIFQHGRRTARIALHLAEKLDLDVNHQILYSGALFHDIGKGSDPHNESGACMTKPLRMC